MKNTLFLSLSMAVAAVHTCSAEQYDFVQISA
jgi:hypothetical protein